MKLLSEKICSTCGSSLELDMLSGFCPGCLLDTVLEAEGASVAGRQIEDYELLDEIARGGMGIVYRARQRVPSRVVALKMILPVHLQSSDAVERFRAEAEAAASLDHDCILPIYAVGEHDGAPFYSMKFAQGGTLANRLKEFLGKPREAAGLIAKLARAVAYAHEHGVLHRDLKPGNALFDSAGKPYVSDFGLAKWLKRECDLTQTLAILGTPYYMAPEQATNSRAVTAAADVYSLGAILYHMLSGAPPFTGETPMEVLHRAATEKPKAPRLTSRDLETICMKCLEKEPAARYQSAAVLADDLERFCADRPIKARPIGRASRVWRWSRRNPVPAGLSALTLLLLVVIATLFPTRRDKTQSAPPTKAVAVLPFDHPGVDQTGELLASGLQDDILVNLSKIGDLKVISRDSVQRFAGSHPDPAQIGRALKVDAVLVGSLRQSGTHARVGVHLMRTADGTEIWADNFDRELGDVFGIQSDLALQIASALKATVLPMEVNGIRKRPTNDMQAYLLYVRANDLLRSIGRAGPHLAEVKELLERAIKRDPKFALAVALLSQTETLFAQNDEKTRRRILSEAKEHADEALRFAPDLPEAHMAMGRYLWEGKKQVGEMDLAGALHEFEIAQRALPNDAEVRTFIARVQRLQGKWTDALVNFEEAAALDPNNSDRWNRLYSTNLWMRRYPAALQALEREIALLPNAWRTEWCRAVLFVQWKGDTSELERLRPPPLAEQARYAGLWYLALMWRHRFDQAEAFVREYPGETMPDSELSAKPKSATLGEICLARGELDKARAYFQDALPSFERAVAESPTDPDERMGLAFVYACLDRKEDAVREGQRACELLPEAKDALDGVDLTTGMAKIYLKLNEPERALLLLEHVLSVPGGPHVGQLRVAPIWSPMLKDARFQRLLATYQPSD